MNSNSRLINQNYKLMKKISNHGVFFLWALLCLCTTVFYKAQNYEAGEIQLSNPKTKQKNTIN